MKRTLCTVVVLLSLFSFELHAQQGSVSLYHVVSSYTVTYKTSKAIVRFYNQDIIDRFDKERMESWFTSLSEDQKKKYEEAIAWLKAGNSITLSEQPTSAKHATELSDLIIHVIGAELIQNGKAHVTNLTNQVQNSVRYERSNRTSEWKMYDFYFIDDVNPFFTGQSKEQVKEEIRNMEVSGDEVVEVVFEEPVEQIVSQNDENVIFTIVEESPTYPGGMTKFAEYVTKNLKYPKSAVKSGIQGTVFVSFVVEKDGALSEMNVIKGLEGEDCNKEAMRLIRASGKWTPGKQNGKTQRVRFVLPVKFKLPEKK